MLRNSSLPAAALSKTRGTQADMPACSLAHHLQVNIIPRAPQTNMPTATNCVRLPSEVRKYTTVLRVGVADLLDGIGVYI